MSSPTTHPANRTRVLLAGWVVFFIYPHRPYKKPFGRGAQRATMTDMNTKNIKTSYLVGIIAVAVIALLVLGRFTSRPIPPPQNIDPKALAGIQAGTTPWKAETDHLLSRLRAIGLPALSQEGNALHIHQHLDLFIHRDHLSVPANIGVNEAARFISPVHTHDTSGVLHVESPTVQNFTLGQFFDIWGVRFDKECIGGYCTDATNTLNVFVNGASFTADPRSLVLASHQEIVVAYGSAEELPSPVPSSHSFAPGT